MVKKVSERWEAWMRIVVGIISGIILEIWKVIIQVLGVVHWIIVVFSGKRNKGIADFSEIWNTQMYIYLRYMTFVTNERPFPFGDLGKNLSKFK